jgi:hypothetical protein
MNRSSGRLYFNQRKEPRRSYSGHITFAYKNHLYEGNLKNYGSSGLFIKTKKFLFEGEVITVVLPHLNYKNNIRKARIIRTNTEGCGVQLCE